MWTYDVMFATKQFKYSRRNYYKFLRTRILETHVEKKIPILVYI